MRFIFFSLLMSSLLLSKSNILIITIDDLKPALACYGDELAISPEIDSLARSGTLFNSAYCQQAVCAPSRISMFTGLRPDSTGILNLHTYMRDINPAVITLPQFFRDQGYVTVGYGKLLHGAKNDDQKKSWTELGRDLPFNDSLNPPILEKFQDSETRKVFDKLLSENKNLKNSLLVKKLKENNVYPVSEALEIPDDAYRDGAVAKLGVIRLREFKQSKENFLMVLGFNKPPFTF